MPAFLRILLSLLFIAGIALLLTWFTLWQQNMCDVDATWEFIKSKADLAAYTYALICLLSMVLATITWRPFFSMGLVFAFLSVIMFIYMQKYEIRAAPLLPEDFQMADQAGTIMEFVDIWAIVRLVAGIIFVLVGAGILEHAMRKLVGRSSKDLPWWERFAVLPRVSFTLLLIAIFFVLARPVLRPSEAKKDESSWLPSLELVAWDQTVNYENNGFVIAFLYNLGTLHGEPPAGYDEQAIRQIAEKYQQIAKTKNASLKPLDEIADNIILVMNESFYDPLLTEKTYPRSGGDIVPNLHKIFREYPSGYMYSPEYGGNTANVEFAAFTGLSNFWAQTIPYVRSVAGINYLPGLASWAKDTGFQTTAVHAYDKTMYKRNLVYAGMQFETFLDENSMTHTELENGQGYISDAEVYAEILDVLSDGEKHMVGAITMQNHSPYGLANYPEFHFRLKNPDSFKNSYNIQATWESLNKADQYLGDFIKKLDELEEKTVLIWFGDHAAGVLEEYILSDDKTMRDYAHLVPYFVYANFEIENKLSTSEVAALNRELGFVFPTREVDLPVVAPNCLANTLYNLLDAEKPALLYLNEEICEQTPILAPSYFTQDLEINTDALRAYQMINYDVLSGRRYWLESSR